MCCSKHVEQLRNTGIINSTTRLHLVGSFYEFYITMHGSMNIKFKIRKYVFHRGRSVAHLSEALRYKPEGRVFDSRWRHWNFF